MTASWLLVAVCAAIIFALSNQPADESAQLSRDTMNLFWKIFGPIIGHYAFRKAAHALEYCGLALLMFNASHRTFGYARPVVSFALTVAYAVTDEIHQFFVPGRACRVFDLFVDSCGAAVGIAACVVILLLWQHIYGSAAQKAKKC